jgi:hypothetical protein
LPEKTKNRKTKTKNKKQQQAVSAVRERRKAPPMNARCCGKDDISGSVSETGKIWTAACPQIL